MDIFGNLAGMVTTAFKVPGDHDVVSTARDIFRVIHHVGYPFPEDRVPEGIDLMKNLVSGKGHQPHRLLSHHPPCF
jgi:hypothetical protein